MSDDDLTHYMKATSRLRAELEDERAERLAGHERLIDVEDKLDALNAENARLRAEQEREANEWLDAEGILREKWAAAEAESQRLRYLVADIFTAMRPPRPAEPGEPITVIEHTELPAMVGRLATENVRLRAVADHARNVLVWAKMNDLRDGSLVALFMALNQIDPSGGSDHGWTGEAGDQAERGELADEEVGPVAEGSDGADG